MKKCIEQVVENVQSKFYGSTAWDVTGPTMVAQVMGTMEYQRTQELVHVFDPVGQQYYISFEGKNILTIYPEYRIELEAYRKKNHQDAYYELWNQRKIYKEYEGVPFKTMDKMEVLARREAV